MLGRSTVLPCSSPSTSFAASSTLRQPRRPAPKSISAALVTDTPRPKAVESNGSRSGDGKVGEGGPTIINGQVRAASLLRHAWSLCAGSMSISKCVTRWQIDAKSASQALCQVCCSEGALESSAMVVQVLHSINLHQLDLIHSMDSYMEKQVMPILKDVKTMWQPSDFLPDSASPDFLDQVQTPADVPCIMSQQMLSTL